LLWGWFVSINHPDGDVTEVWSSKISSDYQGKKDEGRGKRSHWEAPNPDEKEVEKTFWLSRPDGWVMNKKTKHITPTWNQYRRGNIHPS
jgi:hypothetical protein